MSDQQIDDNDAYNKLNNNMNEEEYDNDEDLQDEDLDAFLVLLESRLRADFTSPDLSRIISSQGTSGSSSSNIVGISIRGTTGGGSSGTLISTLPSGNQSSPSKFLRLIRKVFVKAGKPVKLRSLMSVLGLDDDKTVEEQSGKSGMHTSSYALTTSHSNSSNDEGKKTDSIVWQLLTQAENDDEKWVRVIAGIIKRIMFTSESSDVTTSTTVDDSNDKETESEKQLRKIVNEILSNVNKSCTDAEERMNTAKQALYTQIDEESTDEIEVQQKRAQVGQTLSTLLIGTDRNPTYTPFRYTLLSPSTIKAIIPGVDNNPHFVSNMDANVLKVDAEVEEKRAEEEGRELTTQKAAAAKLGGNDITGSSGAGTGNGAAAVGKSSQQQQQTSTGGTVLAGQMRGRFSNMAGRGTTGRGSSNSNSGGSSLFRPSTTLGGRGSAGGRAGRSLASLVGGGRAGRIPGRGGRAAGGRLGTAGRAAGLGRGSLSAPLQRRVPGAARALVAGSRGGGGGETKMKMIDASEIEGLTRVAAEREKNSNMTSVQARKSERKRKLLQDAAASGLRNRERKIARTDESTSAAQAASETNAPENNGNNSTAAGGGDSTFTSLLEKSNKLTPEDRQTIQQFFQHRNNSNNPSFQQPPIQMPAGVDEATGIWKVKINEDKTVDGTTGESVKETLYLELDYKALGYKKTRKIKRK